MTLSEMPQFKPDRIELGRQRPGMSTHALAAEIGVTSRELRRFQVDGVQPTKR